jgi:hypothetical protein
MTRHKLVNGEKINLTPAEETARDQEEAQALIDQQAIKDAEANKETKKASGKQKLKDLGLDDDEIQALIGV